MRSAYDSDALAALDEFLGEALAGLSEPKRRKASRKIGMALRRANSDRIRRNVEPDGSKMEKRRPRLDQRGRVRRSSGGKMFRKLRLARNFKIKAQPDSVELTLSSGAHIAKVHHFGLRGYVGRAPDGSKVYHRYDERLLLGFSDGDKDDILDVAAELIDKER